MPEEKGLGSKLLGLFVEVKPGSSGEGDEVSEPSDAGESADQSPAAVVAALASQSARLPPPAAPLPTRAQGNVAPAQVDFDAVFKTAGMDGGDLDRVRKAEELLKGLPAATPVDVKRQIVEASLKAFGFDIAKIIGAAQSQLKALDTYVRLNEQQSAKSIADAQAHIASLEDKIISLKVDITKRTEQLASIAAAADARKVQVQQVLEFFNTSVKP